MTYKKGFCNKSFVIVLISILTHNFKNSLIRRIEDVPFSIGVAAVNEGTPGS
jgi:hypothetical protein